jgi:hypothetical protein
MKWLADEQLGLEFGIRRVDVVAVRVAVREERAVVERDLVAHRDSGERLRARAHEHVTHHALAGRLVARTRARHDAQVLARERPVGVDAVDHEADRGVGWHQPEHPEEAEVVVRAT